MYVYYCCVYIYTHTHTYIYNTWYIMWICDMNIHTVFLCYLKAEHSYEIFHKLNWRNNYLRTHLANGCKGKMEIKHSLSCVHSLWPQGLHTRLPCSPTPGSCSNSCPSSRWCHPISISSVIPFSSCLQSFPASGYFLNESVLHIK